MDRSPLAFCTCLLEKSGSFIHGVFYVQTTANYLLKRQEGAVRPRWTELIRSSTVNGMGPIESKLIALLQESFSPEHLELNNESHMHSVPPGAESHFRAVIVSVTFEGISRVERSRAVFKCIDECLKAGVHAFTMRALTPAEYEASKRAGSHFESPECHAKTPSTKPGPG